MDFRNDDKLTDVLRRQAFTLSAEVIPPRNGAEQSRVLDQVKRLKESGAQFFSVTKGAGGSLRGGSLPIVQMIKERLEVPCVAHFTCRDLTTQEVENQLMDHHYFGIRNILALRGDPPEGQPDWKPREGGHEFAHQLIEQIRHLNSGRFLVRPGGREVEGQQPTDFCIGAAVYPEFPDEKKRYDYFTQKVEAGAHFAISDMLFDWESYARFLDGCVKRGLHIPILPGTRILKSRSQALKMAERFKVSVRKDWIARLPETTPTDPGSIADGLKAGIELFLDMTEQLKRVGAPGIHVFVISDTDSSCFALKELTQASVRPA